MMSTPTTDKGYAWVIPFVCFFIQATLFGTYRVYGLLYTVLIDTFNVSRSTAAWPFSLCMTFVHLTGPVSGLLNNHFSSRTISFVGCALASLGVGLCYTSTSVIQIILYIGVIQGFGIGLTYVQNNAIINQYFLKYRATANGISLSGGTIGSFALSYLVELCLKYYSLQEIFLILSLVILSTLPVCLLMKPFHDVKQLQEYKSKNVLASLDVNGLVNDDMETPKLSSKELSLIMKNERKRINENNEKVMKLATVYLKSYKLNDGLTFTGSNQVTVDKPSNYLVNNLIINSNNHGFIRRQSVTGNMCKVVSSITKKFERRVSIGSTNCCNQDVNFNHDPRMSRSNTVNSRTAVLVSSDSQQELAAEDETSTKSLIVSILKNKMFMLICLTHMAYFWSSITYTMIIVDHSLDKGVSISQAVNLLNGFAAGDLIGRLGSGWFMDNKVLPLQCLSLISTTGIGLLLIVTPLTSSYYSFIAISAIQGLLAGTINILLNVLFCKYVGSSKAALAFGLSAFFCGLGTLGRPLVVGHFRDQIDGSYDGLFVTLGIITIVIGCLWLFESLIKSNCKSVNDVDEDTNCCDSSDDDPKTSTESLNSIPDVVVKV